MSILDIFKFDLNSDENQEIIQRGARGLLESKDGHKVIRDVIRYTLAEPETRAIILAGLGESLMDEHFKKDVSARIVETKEIFVGDLELFKSNLERGLGIQKETLLRDAGTAWKGAEAAFEATLQKNTAAAIERGQTRAEAAIKSLEAVAGKRFESELEQQGKAVSGRLTQGMNRAFERYEKTLRGRFGDLLENRAEPLIREAVHDLFQAILGHEAAKRVAGGYAQGMGQGKSEGYQHGHAVGRGEGLEEGRAEGYQEGRSVGYSEGFGAGHSEGYDAGFRHGIDRRSNNIEEDAWLLDMPFNKNLLRKVDELELSMRSANCLKNDNIVYIGDLVQKCEAEMLRMPDFGRVSLNEIKEVLAQMGLHLGMEITNWPPENIEELARRLNAPY